MDTLSLTRRAALLGVGAIGAALLGACNAPQTPAMQAAATPTAPGIHIGAIQVDTTPLLAQVGDPTASWAQQALPAQLAQALASRMAPGEPGAATLSVVVNSINLGGGGPANPDIMTGVATLNGRQTTIKARLDLISRIRPTRPCRSRLSRAGFRTSSQAFAYRLRRKLHL